MRLCDFWHNIASFRIDVPLLESQRHSQFLEVHFSAWAGSHMHAICACVRACRPQPKVVFYKTSEEASYVLHLSPRSMTSASRVISSFFRAQRCQWTLGTAQSSQCTQPSPPTTVLESSHTFHSRNPVVTETSEMSAASFLVVNQTNPWWVDLDKVSRLLDTKRKLPFFFLPLACSDFSSVPAQLLAWYDFRTFGFTPQDS